MREREMSERWEIGGREEREEREGGRERRERGEREREREHQIADACRRC